MPLRDVLLSLGRSLARTAAREGERELRRRTRSSGRRSAPSRRGRAGAAGRSSSAAPHGGYAGDFEGRATVTYDPHDDGVADPGEVVWTWVPYEEDHSQGKDRPVLVVGRDGHHLLALMLTSKDHDRDAADEARHGREWLDLGSGAWDSRGRPSEVRVDRVLRVEQGAVRREGGRLDRARFDEVAAALRARHGWR
ncbi:hypothetical protein GCM10027446_16740 [Angustibacter peucedani]